MAKGGYQKRRIQAKKDAERAARKRAQRNRTIMRTLIGVGIVALAGVVIAVALGGGDKKPAATTSPTPSATPSATPTANPTPKLAFPTPCTSFSSSVVGKKTFERPPCKVIDTKKTYTATLQTSMGTIKLKLLDDAAPVTVNNFVFLARAGYYDNSIFHRVIANFNGKAMLQGGDAVNRDGTGGPGYQFGDENMIPFDKAGYLAMANSGPGSNGSQFFILESTVDHLNVPGNCGGNSGCHTVFGQVIDGLPVVTKIGAVKTQTGDKPEKDVVVQKVTIAES